MSFPLADIGEGIAEVEVLEWFENLLAIIAVFIDSCSRFVKEGDEVEEFTKLCQVQSDKVVIIDGCNHDSLPLHSSV